MSITKKVCILLLSLAAMLFLPWLGSYMYYHGAFPDGFFAYPPLAPMPKPGFDMTVFIVVAILCAIITAVYLFPQLFWFKKVDTPIIQKPKVKWPMWFWFGLLCWGGVMCLFIFKVRNPVWLVHWSDLPLFWGTTLILDGWVYKRNGGVSLMSKVPQELVGIGVASVSGWMIFEFLNFFIDDNWYYPKGNMIGGEEFLLYACIISSGLLPIAFEWYCLFKTFPKLTNRFNNGLKIKTTPLLDNLILLVCYGGMFASGLFPDTMFFILWLGPPIILAVVLKKVGVWNPVKDIGEGNWTPSLLSALTYFFTGLCLEGQNYLSAIHQPNLWTEDPAYWQYSLPYVDVLHVFEMPLLGLYGYLPFGIYCWLWWILWATLMNIPARFLKADPLNFDTNP
jgi:hypothetical protein